MSNPKPTIAIRLLDKTFHLKCPLGQEELLKESASALHQRLSAIQTSSQETDFEKLLLSAAMNVTADWLTTERAHSRYIAEIDETIKHLDLQLAGEPEEVV